jgi:predicted nuclease with TOPRIM domain
MGFLLLSSREKQNEELSRSREKIRNFTQETIRLRAGAERLKGRSAELEAKYQEAAEKLKRLGPPPAAVMEESHLPFGEAAEAVPGRLFITVARVAGGRGFGLPS